MTPPIDTKGAGEAVPEHYDLLSRAQLESCLATAERERDEAKAMIATLESEQQAMQAAIWRWVPHVRDSDAPVDVQAGDDAMLLVGFNGDSNLPQYGEQLYTRAETAEGERDEARSELAEAKAALQEANREVSDYTSELAEVRKDKARLDWLERQYVEVRKPLLYGSRAMFIVSPGFDEDGDEPNKIRTAIDAHAAALSAMREEK